MRTLNWFTAREKYEPVHCKVSIHSHEVGELQLPIANLLILLIYRMKTDTLIAGTQHTTAPSLFVWADKGTRRGY